MDSLAINICILPSKKIGEFCSEIYSNDKSEYSSEKLEYIPHITLYQKAINKNDIPKLIKRLKNINLNKFDIELGNLLFSTLFCLEIKRNKNITKLQKEVINVLSSFPNIKLSRESFLTEKYFYKDNINWVSSYGNYLDYDKNLHITLGKYNQKTSLLKSKPKYFTFDTLGIGIMGNYCSVRKILEIIK